MGRGGTNSLWSSGITCKAACVTAETGESQTTQSERSKYGVMIVSHLANIPLNYNYQCYRDKPYGQLVLVSLMHYCTSTPSLSTSWSRTTLQGAQGSGKSHLKASFPLRRFQRLSLPNLATRQCHWRDNRYTRGSSTPVLSY